MTAPYRDGGPGAAAPAPRDRALPAALRRAVWLAPGGNLLLGLVALAAALWVGVVATWYARFAPTYDARAVGRVLDCEETWVEQDDGRVRLTRLHYTFTSARGVLGGGAADLGDAPCVQVGSPIDIKYFADDPVRSSPTWSNEYAPRLHFILGGAAAVLAIVALALLLPEVGRRRRVLHAVRTGHLVRARLRGLGARRTVDFWGTEEVDHEFELPGELELIGRITVPATSSRALLDDETEALLLEPPYFRTAVAVDTLPGRLVVDAEAVVRYQPPASPPWAARLLLGLAAGAIVAHAVVALA